MNQDKKLGLALGILLIGTVAALFFRNEQELSTEVPQLNDARVVDEEIDEGFGPRPYPVEPFRGAEISGGPQVGLTDDAANNLDHLPRASGSGQLFPSPEPGAPSVDGDRLFPLGPPDPVRITGSENSNRTVPAPVPNQDPNSNWSSAQPSDAEATSAGGDQAPIMYRIQPGDTLTGLARKFLGTTQRFPEIYQLNQDRMRSPDDLVVGKTIRIPAKTGAAPVSPVAGDQRGGNRRQRKTTVQPVSSSGPQSSGQPTNDDRLHSDAAAPRPGGKRFIRATRSPLRPVGPITRPRRKPLQPDLDAQTPTRSTQQSEHKQSPSNRYYTVRRGDSLEKIAVEQYGNRFAARKIFEANRKQLSSPNALPAGVRIRLP